MPQQTTTPTPAQDLAQVLAFCKRVRTYAAGHSRGGLGLMHRMAGESVQRLERVIEQLPPEQPELLPQEPA